MLLRKEKKALKRRYILMGLLILLLLVPAYIMIFSSKPDLLGWVLLNGIFVFFFLAIFIIAYMLSTVERLGGTANWSNIKFLGRINFLLVVLLMLEAYLLFIRPELEHQNDVHGNFSFVQEAGSDEQRIGHERMIQLDRLANGYLKDERKGRKNVIYKYMAIDTVIKPVDTVYAVELLFEWEQEPRQLFYKKIFISSLDEITADSTTAQSVPERVAFLLSKAKKDKQEIDSLFEAFRKGWGR